MGREVVLDPLEFLDSSDDVGVRRSPVSVSGWLDTAPTGRAPNPPRTASAPTVALLFRTFRREVVGVVSLDRSVVCLSCSSRKESPSIRAVISRIR